MTCRKKAFSSLDGKQAMHKHQETGIVSHSSALPFQSTSRILYMCSKHLWPYLGPSSMRDFVLALVDEYPKQESFMSEVSIVTK